ncbi:MAG: DNA repair protein RecO [Paludibacteraceae bacterium]|nr:DNA repair protein RecO [Paludibacteraceae bacterium]MCQ2345133.1 DNA repair protein RecO [Paludibacteraceae bacterium]
MKAIVLNAVRYSDNSFMVSMFTDQQGLVTVNIHTGVKRSRFKRSYLSPLSILEVQLSGKPSSEVKYISDCALAYPFRSLDVNPMKILEAQFVAEMLQKSLRYQQQDPELFEFVRTSVITMDESSDGVNDCHIIFLTKLMSYVGIMPDISDFDDYAVLDIEEGRMTAESFGECLNHKLSECLVNIIKDEPFRLTSSQRSEFIDFIVRYYQHHLFAFGNIKTLEVFREMAR